MKEGLTAQPTGEAPLQNCAADPASPQPLASARLERHGVRSLHLLRTLCLLLLFGFLFLVLIPIPRIILLRWRDPKTTAFIESRKATLRAHGRSDAIDRRPLPLRQVSPALIQAVLAAEDARFFEHHGIDWEAVSSAREWNQAHAHARRRRLHGGSTITQQLAKNLWLTGERTWWRKAREGVDARADGVCVLACA